MMKMFSRHKDWDAPRATGDVASADLEQAELLLAQLTQPALSHELVGEDAAVAAMGARIRIAGASGKANAATAARPARRAGRVVAVALCVFTVTTGAAFAGVLPDPVQKVAHSVLERVGVVVPKPASMPDIPSAGDSNAPLSNRAHTPGATAESKGAIDSGSPPTGTSGGATVEPGSSDTPGKAHGKGNHGASGAAKNAHGKATSAAHKNGGNAGGASKTPPGQSKPKGGGKPAVKGGGKPAGAGSGKGGGKPADKGGGKPADAGSGKGKKP
jgi:hypothetical protein